MRLLRAPIVPLMQSDDPKIAVQIANALVDGGLTVLEVVLRTESALECLRAVIEAVPQAIVGAGTVLTETQALESIDAGAAFLVSPGFFAPAVKAAQNAGIDVFPGVATATEALVGYNAGLRVLKFFPAGQAGGVSMLKALSAVYRDVKFMPTGGVSAQNLADYLAIDTVIACGGSWLTPKTLIDKDDFESVTRLALEACAIANEVRGL